MGWMLVWGMSFLCHFTLILDLVTLKNQPSVCGSCFCAISEFCSTFLLPLSRSQTRCIIKKYGPYFLFIYADSTVLAVPVDLLFCSPSSSCPHWADLCRIKRFLKSWDNVSEFDFADMHNAFWDKTPFIYHLQIFILFAWLLWNSLLYKGRNQLTHIQHKFSTAVTQWRS